MRLTAASVDALTLDGASDKIIFDDDVPGFGIRLRSSGKRSWIYQYKIGGKTRRLALGEASALKVAKARDIASDLHARVRLGGDPASEKREKVRSASDTFGVLVDRFLEHYRGRESTVTEVTRHLKKYALPLHTMPVGSIGLRDIADLLSKIDKASGAVTANRVRSSVSMLFAWGMREGLVLANPVVGTSKRQEVSRNRVLSDDELRAVWNAASEGRHGPIVRLLILTGQRRSEIDGLRWSEVDLERRTLALPAERTKNKRAHVVPLAPTALALLSGLPRNGDLVFDFNAWAYAKELLDARSGVTGWTVHDLRRTTATGMADIGIAPHIIEAVLNHVSGHKGGVAGIYNRASYATEKAEALARWDEHVTSVVGGM